MLFAGLMLSAGAALFVQPAVVDAVRAERLSAGWLVVAPAFFAGVVAVAAVDVWRTARRRGYFRGPSVVLLAACVAFMGLLFPSTFSEYRARTSPPYESDAWHRALVKSRDPRVRALVMEVAGLKPDLLVGAELLEQGLADPDPLVVKAALAAVEHRSGTELHSDDPVAAARRIVEGWRRAP